MFDELQIGGVVLYLLILGIVEAAKRFGVKDKGSFALALVLGVFLFGLAKAIELGLVPANALPWIEVTVFGFGGALAVTGLYDLAKRLFPVDND